MPSPDPSLFGEAMVKAGGQGQAAFSRAREELRAASHASRMLFIPSLLTSKAGLGFHTEGRLGYPTHVQDVGTSVTVDVHHLDPVVEPIGVCVLAGGTMSPSLHLGAVAESVTVGIRGAVAAAQRLLDISGQAIPVGVTGGTADGLLAGFLELLPAHTLGRQSPHPHPCPNSVRCRPSPFP